MRRSAIALSSLCFLIASTAALRDEASEMPESAACLTCHGVEGSRPAGEKPDGTSLYVEDWQNGVHAMLECTDCHTSITELPHDSPVPPADCSSCHAEETESYRTSAHGRSSAAGDSLAPSCASCHDPHSIRNSEDPRSLLHRSQLAAVCTKCHGNQNGAGGRATAVPHPAQSYARGAHARAMAAGNQNAATCKDCHDSHGVRPANDPTSSVYFTNIPGTCGRCHTEEFEAYAASVHAAGAEKGAVGAPVCNTCHGEHAVLDLGEPGQSLVIASETCESCHRNPALARRYDLPQGAVTSYEDSYHGRAARGGLASAAGCTSCHGVHRILSAANPQSTINPNNLLQTCRGCHTQATAEFASSYAHTPRALSAADRGSQVVRGIYLWLIGLVIGGMLLHNAMVLGRDLRGRWERHKRDATYERLNRNELSQHAVLLSTFILLVLTGFALKYPDTFWARGLEAAGMNEGLRRIVHRIAAVGMILASLYHLVYLLTRRGREQMHHMLPRMRDVREFSQNVAFHLGRRSSSPDFGRFRYIEKAEYWALVWGTLVMVLTGFILWFPDRLTGPNWMVRVAEAIHLYEAWLALLAIVVWHFFFVMLRPDTFPLSFTVFTGRMDPHELEHEHPEEYRRHYARRLHRPPPGTAAERRGGGNDLEASRPNTDALQPNHENPGQASASGKGTSGDPARPEPEPNKGRTV